MHGLRGKGWMPAVNFWFDNQIVVGVPGRGSYVFYDKHQLATGAEKFKDVQESIDANPNFVSDFKKRTNELFGAIFSVCDAIASKTLSSASDTELKELYRAFIQAVMAAPVITVQVWGIEACFDDGYRIMRFLRTRLEELHKGKDFELYKSLLAVNTGETVAFSERKNFYEVALELAANPEVAKLFAEDVANVSEKLKSFPLENELFETHIKKYEWVNTEYVGRAWTREKWVELYKKALLDPVSPRAKLAELHTQFEEANAERGKALLELNPPADVAHAIDALAELIAQRDWTKGYMTKAFLSYHLLLDEIAQRMGLERADLFLYSYIELDDYLENSKKVSTEEIESRKKDGFIIRIKLGTFELITGKDVIANVITGERISEPFEKVIHMKEFKGLAASRGKITGKARVLEDASRIGELEKGEILVTYMTTIEFIPAFRKASGVVTDEGGMSCHAAIISREFKLPCVVGTKVATRVLQTGDHVEVDAEKGIVRILG
jgi:phosphohistidine swiveling domain-containing protein